MKLVKKLENLKNSLVEGVNEYRETYKMSADDYAKRYGYEKLLEFVRNNLITVYSEFSEVEEKSLTINIKVLNDDNIVILNNQFGIKEKFQLKVLATLFAKDDIELVENLDKDHPTLTFKKYTIDEILEEELKEETITEEKSSSSMDVYLKQAKTYATIAGKATSTVVKKTLSTASDWAKDNL